MRRRPSYPRFDASENPQRTRGATDPIMGAKVRHNRDNRGQPEAFHRPGIVLNGINQIHNSPMPVAASHPRQHSKEPASLARGREHGEAENQKGRSRPVAENLWPPAT